MMLRVASERSSAGTCGCSRNRTRSAASSSGLRVAGGDGMEDVMEVRFGFVGKQEGQRRRLQPRFLVQFPRRGGDRQFAADYAAAGQKPQALARLH